MGVLCLSLLLRLLHLWMIADTPLPKHHLTAEAMDDYAFYRWAQTILAGDWLGRNTYHPYFDWMQKIAPLETWYRWWGGKEIFQQAPLYPYLLAGLLVLSGGSVLGVLLTQLAIGAVQPLIIYRLASFVFDSRVALAAAAMTAVYGPLIFHEGVLLRDWLSPILEPLALVALLLAKQRGQGWVWGVAGGILGVALLAKENVLLLILLMLVWIILDHWGAWRQTVRAGAWMLIGLVLTLSPLMLRNAAVGAPILALSNRATEVLVLGNAANISSVSEVSSVFRESEGSLPSAGKAILQTYRDNARTMLDRLFWKLKTLKDPIEVPNDVSFAYGMDFSPVLRWSLGYGFIFPLGLAGVALSLRAWRRQAAVLLYGISAVITLMVLSPISRYRLALVPLLIVYGAVALIRLAVAVRECRFRPAAGILGLIIGCALFQHMVLRLPESAYRVYPPDYFAGARAYAESNQFNRAAVEMARLRERLPQYPQFASARSDASLLEGDYRTQRARQLLAEGKQTEARQQTALAEAAYGQHPNLSYPNYNLGLLYLRLGEAEKARGCLERFLTLEPSGGRADRVRSLLATLETARGE